MKRTLYLAWQDPDRRRWYPVGRLIASDVKYVFEYLRGALTAQADAGFQPIHAFPDLGDRYQSEELFPLFANRVLSKSRPEYKNVVEWLSLPPAQDDAVMILSRSGGQRATDTFEVYAQPEIVGGRYRTYFLLHGLSHMSPESIRRAEKMEAGERLLLMKDFQNPQDPLAIALRTAEKYPGDLNIVGYCPRYLREDVCTLLNRCDNYEPSVIVERVNPDPAPVQFRILCRIEVPRAGGFAPFAGDEYKSVASEAAETERRLA